MPRIHVPRFRAGPVRLTIGLGAAAIAGLLATSGSGSERWPTLLAFGITWAASVLATDKYRHKHPFRYVPYVLASHGKAAVIMALGLALAISVAGMPEAAVWPAFLGFILFDFLLALPFRSVPAVPFDPQALLSREVSGQVEEDEHPILHDGGAPDAGWSAGLDQVPGVVVDLLREIGGPVATPPRVRVAPSREEVPAGAMYDLLVAGTELNDIGRINAFLLSCAESLEMGGDLACVYRPPETMRVQRRGSMRSYRVRYAIQFLWHRALPKLPVLNKVYFWVTGGRGRHVSRAEIWGRLSYCGFRVLGERVTSERAWLLARRISSPIVDRKPSYSPVVGLTKIGLNGQTLRTHKIRSMYPFSEFLQKQVFETQGLANTGKFKDDFRLTEYGRFLRRYWLDELPQVFDWLRGDIKLVGLRATSPHFLSLYPPEFIDLYLRVKPGLIPPIFDDETPGFEAIVETEFTYLKAYMRTPIRTDVRYLFATLHKIMLRGVRSR